MPKHCRRLDTSVGVSERYDFAVRLRRVRRSRQKRPSHPAPNVCDDRPNAPHGGRGTRGKMLLICPTSQAELPATKWHDGQITSCARNRVKRNLLVASARRRGMHWSASTVAGLSLSGLTQQLSPSQACLFLRSSGRGLDLGCPTLGA